MFKKPAKAQIGEGTAEPAAIAPLRDRLPYTTMKLPTPERSNPWPELPVSNRIFLTGAAICTAWLVLRLGGPPTANAAHEAYFPYTADGKRETCLSNLRALQSALAVYAQDSGGDFPPMETKDGSGNRATWVTLTQKYAPASSFVCPRGPSVSSAKVLTSCAYAMNPVLAGDKPASIDSQSDTVLLADAGTKHDVSLLPDLPTWPSFKAQDLATVAKGSGAELEPAQDLEAENISLRHEGSAGLLFADGHVSIAANDAFLHPLTPWGGSAASRLALARVAGRSAASNQLVALLKAGNTPGAANCYAANKKALSDTANDLVQLWFTSAGQSDSVEAVGWNFAQAAALAGDPTPQQSLDGVLKRRCSEELNETANAKTDPKAACTELTMQVPQNWTVEDASDASHPRTRFRSRVKDISVLVEMGHRNTYSQPGPIEWGGMERELRRTPGAGYKRIQMGMGQLLGMPASVWEFEVNRPGGPRLHKIYYGAAGSWDTYVVVCAAPAVGFEGWRPTLTKMAAELRIS